jgi:hypothetical protein
MRKLICLVMGGILISMLVAGPAFAEMETVKVGKGTLKLGLPRWKPSRSGREP